MFRLIGVLNRIMKNVNFNSKTKEVSLITVSDRLSIPPFLCNGHASSGRREVKKNSFAFS